MLLQWQELKWGNFIFAIEFAPTSATAIRKKKELQLGFWIV
jgi:hypothetical protein